jgi:hypothetical protein
MSRAALMMLAAGANKATPAFPKFQITPASTGTADLMYDLSNASTPAGFWTHVSAGGDINVYAQDRTTRLACHVFLFDRTAHTGIVVFAATGATSFYIAYGTGIATPASNAAYGQFAAYESAMSACFHFVDGSDATSHGNNFTPQTGMTFVAGQIGKAIQCSGNTNSGPMSTVGFPVGNGARTMMTWFRSTLTGANREMFAWGTPASLQLDALARVASNNVSHSHYSADDDDIAVITINTLYHVIATKDAANAYNGYISGVNVHSRAGGPTLKTASGTTGYMGGLTATANLWVGTLCETRIYNREFNATEAAVHFANQNNQATFWTVGGEL